MTNLSFALKKYYVRKKNRIFFSDSISLHEMTLSLWQELGYAEIDASVLSRVLQGERLFTSKQLSAFCKLLGLEKEERENLFTCLAKDLLKREGLINQTLVIQPKSLSNLFGQQLTLLQIIFHVDKQKFLQEKDSFVSSFLSLANSYSTEAEL